MATYYWVGGTGTWDGASTANWAASTGGAPGAGPPTNADNVVFDANSGSGACTVADTAAALAVGLTLANLTVALGANTTPFGAVTLTSGTLDLAGFLLTCVSFSSANTNARTIAFGDTGQIVLTGNNITVFTIDTPTNLAITGTPLIKSTYSGATGTRTFACGASIGESRAVSLSITAGSDTIGITSGSGRGVKNLDFTGFSGIFTTPTTALTVYGDVTLSSTMTMSDNTGLFNFASAGPQTLRTNAVLFKRPLYKGGTGTLTLLDAFTSGPARGIELNTGGINSNGFAVNTTTFTTSGTSAKSLQFGSSTWTITGSSTAWEGNVASLTVTPGTGVIDMTSASAKTFSGGGKTYPTLRQAGAGALTITGSNSFAIITNTVQPATITLTSGTTQTVTDFDASGTSGNLITLNASTPGSLATLTDSGGVNSVSYMDIKDIAATGYGEWQAYTSNGNVDSGNNVGWVFAAPPPLTASEYQISLKSFTERRSF